MPFQYSFEEKTEMLLICGECGRGATLAAETYAARFPQNRAPKHQIFKSLVSSLRERGTFQQNTKSFINPTITHDINQARVLNLVENNPHVGSREISSQIGISKSSVLRILKKHEYHPYIWNFTKNCMVKILQIE
jgi:transcription initiation factor IIE alpha subunit